LSPSNVKKFQGEPSQLRR